MFADFGKIGLKFKIALLVDVEKGSLLSISDFSVVFVKKK